jgi:hypothetical protein
MEVVITKNDAMCKIFFITFHGFAKVWYHRLDTSSILGLRDFYMKLISRFSTSIPVEKNITKIFAII